MGPLELFLPEAVVLLGAIVAFVLSVLRVPYPREHCGRRCHRRRRRHRHGVVPRSAGRAVLSEDLQDRRPLATPETRHHRRPAADASRLVEPRQFQGPRAHRSAGLSDVRRAGHDDARQRHRTPHALCGAGTLRLRPVHHRCASHPSARRQRSGREVHPLRRGVIRRHPLRRESHFRRHDHHLPRRHRAAGDVAARSRRRSSRARRRPLQTRGLSVPLVGRRHVSGRAAPGGRVHRNRVEGGGGGRFHPSHLPHRPASGIAHHRAARPVRGVDDSRQPRRHRTKRYQAPPRLLDRRATRDTS